MNGLPQYRVYVSAPRHWRWLGCLGCAGAIFIVGGIVGVLLFGWKTLLGM